MKKVTQIVMIFTFCISSYLSINIFKNLDSRTFFYDNNQTVHIEAKNIAINAAQFILDIEKTAEEENLSIKRVAYSPIDNGKKEKIIYYIYNSKENPFFSNIPLRWGRYLNLDDGKAKFLSNQKTKDPNQIGQIDLFDNSNLVEIRPMSAMENHLYGTDYVLSTKDIKVAQKFSLNLSQKYKFTSSVNAQNNISDDNDIKNNLLYLGYFGLVLCLCILTAVAFLYFVIFRFKEIAIRKMFGYRNKDIIRDLFLLDCFPMIIIAFLVSVIITIIYLWNFNSLARFFYFIRFWMIFLIVTAVVFLVLFTVVSQIIRFAKSTAVLKNSKPVHLIKRVNYVVKAIFSILAVSMFIISFQDLSTIIKQNSNLSKWNQTKYYATIGFTVDDSIMDDYVSEYNFNTKIQKLCSLLNNNGAMLFSPSSYYSANAKEKSQYDQFPTYSPYKESVCINNNYLKLNPIYNLDGNRVEINNEDTDNMTILVPVKYKNYSQIIKKLYQDYSTIQYYGPRDHYAKLTGENINYDPTDKQQILAHHSYLELQVIYVKNNQSYFSYDPNVSKKTNNAIIDPIAMIINNNNGDIHDYPAYLSRGEIRARVANYYNPSQSVNKQIVSAGLQNNIVQITSLYDTVGQYMYNTITHIVIEILVMTVSFCIVALIIFFSTLNYLEEEKSINAVKRIHGYSFFKRHFKYLIYPALFWTCVWIVLIQLFLSGILNDLFTIGIAPLLFIIEEIATIFILQTNEYKKQKDILKGG